MYLRSIGFRIANHLVIFLVFAMLLVNIVVVYFWQQDVIQLQIQHTKALLTRYGKQPDLLCSKKGVLRKNIIETICAEVGKSCEGAAFYDGNEITSLNEIGKNVMSNDLMVAVHEVDIALHKHGTRWGIYSPLSQEVVLALPVNNSCINNGSLGVMIAPLTVVEAVKKSQPIIFLYIITNALVLATLCFFRFSNIVIQPLKNLVTISENYSDKEMIFFSSDTSNSDFRKLSTALNSMISRIESDRKQLRQNISSLQHANDQLIASQKEMVRAEKLAAIGRLSAGLAHEIGNPIGIVQGYIELLGNDDISQEDRKQFSQRADKEVQRIDKLVRQLLDLTRLPSSASGTAHVNVVLDTISEIFTTHKDMEKIDIIKTLEAKNDLVAVHKDSLHQVLLNCLLNSIDAIIEKTGSKEGTITLYSKNSFQGQKEVYCLEIQDNGIGIKEEDFDSVLDPFFSTKEPGKGTGLGLSVSASIIEGIGGKITLKSEYEKGTVVSLTLPISHESSPTDSTKNSELKG